MLSVLIREVGFLCRDSPINAKAVIKDADASICLWVIELIALVLEDCCLREDGKAVGKTLWDEEQMQYRWPFFDVNLNVNKVDKERHTLMERCMKPQ